MMYPNGCSTYQKNSNILYTEINELLDIEQLRNIHREVHFSHPTSVIINLSDVKNISIKRKQLRKWMFKFKERGIDKVAFINSNQELNKKIFYYFNFNIENMKLKYFHQHTSAEEWIEISNSLDIHQLSDIMDS